MVRLDRKQRRRLIKIAIGVFAAWILLEIYLAGRETLPMVQTNPPIVLQSGNARGERITTHSWSIDYGTITTNTDQTFIEVQDVRHGLIYRKGKPWLRVVAQRVAVNMITKDFTASGPLHVETVDRMKPRSFDTTSATWSNMTQHLEFNEPTTFTTRAGKLHVKRMTLDVKSGAIHLENISGGIHD